MIESDKTDKTILRHLEMSLEYAIADKRYTEFGGKRYYWVGNYNKRDSQQALKEARHVGFFARTHPYTYTLPAGGKAKRYALYIRRKE